MREKERRTVGMKRNLACAMARGSIILHWDDDDWYDRSRISRQVEFLTTGEFDACGIDRVYFIDPARELAWEYVYPPGQGTWVCGSALCYRKSLWERNRFRNINVGEDTEFVFASRESRIGVSPDNSFFAARVHAGNTSPKHFDSRWRERPFIQVRDLIGADWGRYFGDVVGVVSSMRSNSGVALITAASGIGDIIRVTPLIRVARALGYVVDVLLEPDDPCASELLRDAPEIRRVITVQNRLRSGDQSPIAEIEGIRYDIATFTTLGEGLNRFVKADRRYIFDRKMWLAAGDSACVASVARDLGWDRPMPPPFAGKSARRFDLPPGTIAIHPGCKPNWPWKKWHAFDELAAMFPHVAIIGTAADLDNRRTYFTRPFSWPNHAVSFVGELSLLDTAALISQCRALVALDSGLMHVGVALGVPTFGIFGITNPERESMPSPYMHAISKHLPCEPGCRQESWGRTDCGLHIACLRALTADDVAKEVSRALDSEFAPSTVAVRVKKAALSVNFSGEVASSSGYGELARLYVRALHSAGIDVAVMPSDLNGARIADPLVSDLRGYNAGADFNLFLGVPALWGRGSLSARNAIALTTWETDTMPAAWRTPLESAIDVWLTCKFNVDVFARDLIKEPFLFPCPIVVRPPLPDRTRKEMEEMLRVTRDDFVFYSIFEWQERKSPLELIETFFLAFPSERDVVLAIKTGANTLSDAIVAVERLRRKSGSSARVVLLTRFFEQTQIQALQARGDCYVSLHKGEGWGYPLFEAVSAGKPAIATNYSGPVDYLDPQRHWLVRYELTNVRQRYMYYHPSMKWAQPDLDHARKGMRWVYEHRDVASERAAEAAIAINERYSIETIGALARARLLEHARGFSPAPLVGVSADRKADPLRTATASSALPNR